MVVFLFSLFSILSNGVDQNPQRIEYADSVKRPARTKLVMDSTGTFLTLNRVFIVGNSITRDQIILRELTYKSGDILYSGDLPGVLESDKKKLINTRLFNTVEIRVLELANNTFDLLINVNERWYTFPSIIFELSDRNFNEWWQTYNHDFSRVNYGVKLYQYNMRGRNETLRLTAQMGFTRRFELSYRIPYIDKKQKQGLIVNFDFSNSKNVASQTLDHKLHFIESEQVIKKTYGGGITYTYRKSFYESHSFSVDYRRSNVADTVVNANSNYFGNEERKQEFTALSYSFTSDHRDYVGYPLKGHHFSLAAAKMGLTSNADVQKAELNVAFARYIPLKHNFFLSNLTSGYISTPSKLPYANYGALGYRRQILHGYEIYVIEGPAFAINKTTFKKLLFARQLNLSVMPIEQFRHIPLAIYLKTYADMGYVKNYPNYTTSGRLADKFIYSGGAGIDIVGSYDMVLRFEYSVNAEGDHGFFFNMKKEF
jgi:outer membrane protein assembly factor BamA